MGGHVVEDRTTPAEKPPMERSNEAEPDQLEVARSEGDAYAKALDAMRKEEGGVVASAGNYLVGFVNEQAEGMYALEPSQGLVWREAPEEANAHLEVAVADAADGRFVPGLDVTVTLLDGERQLFTAQAPFLWHPFLYHYGFNAKVPGSGPFTVRIHIEPPSWMRHDPKNGARYGGPVDVVFEDVPFEPGRKPSPEAAPRGEPTDYAKP